MDYKARFYSPMLGKFIQPDTIIPDQSNPQSWNRYSYVINQPVNLNDPTGHMFASDDYRCRGCTVRPDVDLKNGGGGRDGGRVYNGGLGIFTEEELDSLGIHCGENVAQVACDVYTSGTGITYASIEFNFADETIGPGATQFICWAIGQGCGIQSAGGYDGTFRYGGDFDEIYWRRYITNRNSGEMSLLFNSNWSIVEFNGEFVAKETFPLENPILGQLGYGSVYLKPTVVENSIVWSSV